MEWKKIKENVGFHQEGATTYKINWDVRKCIKIMNENKQDE